MLRELIRRVLSRFVRHAAPRPQPLPDPEYTSIILEPPAPAPVVVEPEPLAVQAKKPPKKKAAPKRPTRRVIQFNNILLRIADRFGIGVAKAWAQAVLRYQRDINMVALESAIASKNVHAIEAVIGPDRLQATLQREMMYALAGVVAAAGTSSAQRLAAHGIAISFNAVHPNVVNYARHQAAQLVVGVARQTQQIIAEVIARGASGLLDVGQQARAIREVIGLPPNWVNAPVALGDEIRAGDAVAATSRRLPGHVKQMIRSRIQNGTVSETFIQEMQQTYAASLINLRAHTIAATESSRAAHAGLDEAWKQAQAQDLLPQTVRQFWIVTPDDRLCPICVQIPGMNPNGQRIGDPFDTPEGPVYSPPAPHPNCRCSVALAFDTPGSSS